MDKIPASKNITGTQPQKFAGNASYTHAPGQSDTFSANYAQNQALMKSISNMDAAKALLFSKEKPKLSEVWDVKVGEPGSVITKPAVRDEGIYVSSDGFTKKIGFDGKEMWSAKTGASNQKEAAFDDQGNLFVIGGNHLVKLDAGGDIKWTAEVGSASCPTPPLVTSSAIYTVSEDLKLKCFEMDSNERWSMNLEREWLKAPFCDDNGKLHIVCRTPSNYISHMYIEENKSVFSKEIKPKAQQISAWDPRTRPLICKDGTMYGFRDEKLCALDKEGNEKWSTELPGRNSLSGMEVGPDGHLYVLANDSTLINFSPDGTKQWSVEKDEEYEKLLPNFAWGPDGTTYAIGDYRNPQVYAINPDGSKKWTHRHEHVRLANPAVGPDGTVYVGGDGCDIIALSPKIGDELFTIPRKADTFPDSFRLCPDGNVIVGWSDGYLSCHHLANQEEFIEQVSKNLENTEDMTKEAQHKITDKGDSIDVNGKLLKKREKKI